MSILQLSIASFSSVKGLLFNTLNSSLLDFCKFSATLHSPPILSQTRSGFKPIIEYRALFSPPVTDSSKKQLFLSPQIFSNIETGVSLSAIIFLKIS